MWLVGGGGGGGGQGCKNKSKIVKYKIDRS